MEISKKELEEEYKEAHRKIDEQKALLKKRDEELKDFAKQNEKKKKELLAKEQELRK